MRVKMSALITFFLASVLLLSVVSVLQAADNARFTLKDGVIDDSKLRLQWVPAPNQDMSHDEAEGYVKNLSLSGGGWRLPAREELKSLFDKSKRGNADPLFNVGNSFVWSSESYKTSNSGSAWGLLFIDGKELKIPSSFSDDNFRALAVRSRR